MGLDACVYCDCLEKGRIKRPLPSDVILKVGADGFPSLEKNSVSIWEDDPDWSNFECEHQFRHLIHHRIGNIWLVALLRSELKREASSYPILLEKVVYNGIHAGDYLGLNLIPQLQSELQRLTGFKCVGDAPRNLFRRVLWSWFRIQAFYYSTPQEADTFMQAFRLQMSELAEAALRTGKPISF